MDISNLMANVSNLDEYTSFTQMVNNEYKNKNVQLNISTVLAMKKLNHLELEYHSKRFENGAVCIIFERLLCLPPSNTWGMLAKEFVSCLKFWLNAVRKYPEDHPHQWTFLQTILKFIKEIYLKDSTIPDTLVQMTAEILFDIASRQELDIYQLHEILHCLNIVSAGSSRETRFFMRNSLGDYFIKIASRLCTSGYLPLQYSSLEALVRWLVPRRERELQAAAARWFPEPLCAATARDVFCSADWKDFFQGARNFLNALNESNGLVTSVVCKRLYVGDVVLITGAEKYVTWLDINSSGQSLSVLVMPGALRACGAARHAACDALVLRRDTARHATLSTKSEELTLSINTCGPPCVLPSNIPAGEANDVTFVVSNGTELTRLDKALKEVFGDKYQMQIDPDVELPLSPLGSRDEGRNLFSSEEEKRFSHPVQHKQRRRFGMCVRPRISGGSGLISPSTVSTSSLAGLHDKLAALPKKTFSKVYDKVICVEPELSTVSEIDDRSYNSMFTQNSRTGVCVRNVKRKALPNRPSKMQAESDSEIFKQKPVFEMDLLPVSVSDGNKTNALLAAFAGSSDDSVIDNTKDRVFNEHTNDSIVDSLIQEALQLKLVSTIEEITGNPIYNEERSREMEKNIKDKPIKPKSKDVAKKKNCTVVSKSTTEDESNTEVVYETPIIVDKRSRLARKKTMTKHKTDEKIQKEANVVDKPSLKFDEHTVETFFMNNLTETASGKISISPTLARKINETSSEASENDYHIMDECTKADAEPECNDIDVIECLNNMIDMVCINLNKCALYMDNNEVSENKTNQGRVLRETSNILRQQSHSVEQPKRKNNKAKKTKTKRVPKKKKQKQEQKQSMMSTIIEQTDEDVIEESITTDTKIERQSDSSEIKEKGNESSPVKTPVAKEEDTSVIKINSETRRKRKLYSRKDDEFEKERVVTNISTKTNAEDDDDDDDDDDGKPLSELKTSNVMKTPKNTATCYKEIELHRKQIRLPRSKKRRSNVESSPSPRTLKRNAEFDSLKKTVENSENITLVNKSTVQADVYNFTSDSDDEDFKTKKHEMQKRTNTIDNASAKSARPIKRKTNSKCSKNKSNNDPKKGQSARKKNIEIISNIQISPPIDLINERMRDADAEVLNTSLIIEKPEVNKQPEMEEPLHKPPEMEPETKKIIKKIKKPTTIKKETGLKKDKVEDEGTLSPLPLLVVEPVPAKYKAIETERADMLEKFQKIYMEEDPDGMNESNNTQNLIVSDIEIYNYSPRPDITDKISPVVDENTCKEITRTVNSIKQNIKKRLTLKLSRSEKTSSKNDPSVEIVDDSEPVIRLDEAIPENVNAREDKETRKHTTDVNSESNGTTSGDTSKESNGRKTVYQTPPTNMSQSFVQKSSSERNCVVPLPRLTYDDIYKWIPSRRTSETDSFEINSPKFISTLAEVHDEPQTKYRRVQKESPQCLRVRKIAKSKKKDVTYRQSVCKSPSGSTGILSPRRDCEKPKQKHRYVQKESHESSHLDVKDESINKDQVLSRSVYESPRCSTKESPDIEVPKTSPIISVARISLEDFDKWLPPISTISENEDECEEWLPPIPKRSADKKEPAYRTRQKDQRLTLVYNTRQRYTKNIKDALGNLKQKSETTRKVKSNYRDDNKEDVERTDPSYNTITTRKRGKMARGIIDNDSISRLEQPTRDNSFLNNTAISPVHSFGDGVTFRSDESDEDKGVKISKDKFSKSKSKDRVTTVEASPTSASTSNEMNIPGHESLTSRDMRRQDSTSTEEQEIIRASPELTKRKVPVLRGIKRKDSTSTEVGDIRRISSLESVRRPTNRNAPVPLGNKKMPTLANINDKSVVTDSSDNGFRAESSNSQAIDPIQKPILRMLKEMNANMLEKMYNDTKANVNTRKQLHELNVESQMLLRNQQENIEQKYKNVCDNIMKLKEEFWEKMMKMKDDFWDNCKSSNDRQIRFQENLIERADSLIRADCQRHQATVTILREDTQAVFDYIESKLCSTRRPNEPRSQN